MAWLCPGDRGRLHGTYLGLLQWSPGERRRGNTIVDNTTKNNLPFDLAYDGLGTGDLFGHNQCNTSTPPGLCSADREN